MAADNELARLHAIIWDLRSDLFLYKVGVCHDANGAGKVFCGLERRN